MAVGDPFHLQRFVEAQQAVYTQVVAELSQGEKRSHWMWFIFPQIAGLGSSPNAHHFAITDLEEAQAFVAHAVLGPRLRQCTALVNAASPRSLDLIFGYPDDLKFHSSITLFEQATRRAATADTLFHDTLQLWFGGRQDAATMSRLR